MAFLILAAGESKRMGMPKQLLLWKGKTLINHSIDNAKLCDQTDVFVVLGAYSDRIRQTITQDDINLVFNANWKDGMGTSISAGMRYVDEMEMDYAGVLVALVDQPLIKGAYYKELITIFRSGHAPILASRNINSIGVPALFSSQYFGSLLALSGSQGAKNIILANMQQVQSIDNTASAFDVDTLAAYQALVRENKH